jgi:hypothetical protein
MDFKHVSQQIATYRFTVPEEAASASRTSLVS